MSRASARRYQPSAAPAPYQTPTNNPSSTEYDKSTPLPDNYSAPKSGKDYASTQNPPTDEIHMDENTNNMCWMETKKCCYLEEADGYKCKDYYAHKYSRCYAKFKTVRKCDRAEEHGKPERPKPRVNRKECTKQYYDKNYGPHVEGYPSGGESVWYDAKDLPKKPYGVQSEPQYQIPSQIPEEFSKNSGYNTN
ncbi:hypothetical protein BWQ96_04115 [Gracilariopsis chorda]|uniref:Uncharacterized protein n=1 Tax=Gracilariopsis chorda TaxID=448386 RepID=A0A2V3IVJ2_9FLOR|nr:hypothetical protein BWQ96_04115 [Gracilariopsis chorda]|eukprot:PXF46109.1 hypothetical protein BWQ96_04115 [Gracilariopsis chorda]